MESLFHEMYHRHFNNHEPYDAFVFHAREQLDGISLAGKRVLEIGCGRGSFSLFMALTCAPTKVTSLDEAEGCGADAALFKQLEDIAQQNSIRTIETIRADIAATDFPEKSFDVIVANFSLHHAIRSGGYIFRDQAAQKEIIFIFEKLRHYLADGGVLVLREMSRINFWRFMPYKWKMGHIEWDIHPTLCEWLWALRKAGFKNVRRAFLTPYFLSRLPSLLVRNSIANFFFSSSFYLYAEK